MAIKKLIQCSTKTDKSAVSRRTVNGVEHVIVSSYTLPDNIVMNGGLYPADEIEAGFKSLERTLAPIEHPHDADGNWISASDPEAIHNFHAGAFNVNVTRDNGRVHVEKWINVQEAKKTDRGKRLLDRISEIENSESPRPIHTSTSLWTDVEVLDSPLKNSLGQEYTWIARNMVFDHDAILLDSVGAAQPHQGVGVAVNSSGDRIEVERCNIGNDEVLDQPETAGRMSHEQLRDLIYSALNTPPLSADWVETVFDDMTVFRLKELSYSVPYVVDSGSVKITGIPIRVDRNVVYTPKTNQISGDAMREILLNALSKSGVSVAADISDEDLLQKYNEIQASESSGDAVQGEDLAGVVANALKPLAEEISSLKAKLSASESAERNRMCETISNSGKYSEFDADALAVLPVETLKKMAANSASSHGIPFFSNSTQQAVDFGGPADMPE